VKYTIYKMKKGGRKSYEKSPNQNGLAQASGEFERLSPVGGGSWEKGSFSQRRYKQKDAPTKRGRKPTAKPEGEEESRVIETPD